jgi:hypothetical protein
VSLLLDCRLLLMLSRQLLDCRLLLMLSRQLPERQSNLA